MKRTSGLTSVPSGLARFLAEPAVEKTWAALGNFENGAARRELAAALAKQQHGLCAYCEIDLVPQDIRVDHVVPQSDQSDGPRLSCDPDNLLAVCQGGSKQPNSQSEDDPYRNPARFKAPRKRNLSCDAARGNRPATDFIDPRTVPASPPVMRVRQTGNLEPVPASCAQHTVAPETVAAHIDCLRLNVGRLMIARAAIFETLMNTASRIPEKIYSKYMSQRATELLLPNAEGELPRFFTTYRSFFGPVAETVLTKPPHSWI